MTFSGSAMVRGVGFCIKKMPAAMSAITNDATVTIQSN